MRLGMNCTMTFHHCPCNEYWKCEDAIRYYDADNPHSDSRSGMQTNSSTNDRSHSQHSSAVMFAKLTFFVVEICGSSVGWLNRNVKKVNATFDHNLFPHCIDSKQTNIFNKIKSSYFQILITDGANSEYHHLVKRKHKKILDIRQNASTLVITVSSVPFRVGFQ